MPLAKSWTKRSEETHIASVVDSMGWGKRDTAMGLVIYIQGEVSLCPSFTDATIYATSINRESARTCGRLQDGRPEEDPGQPSYQRHRQSREQRRIHVQRVRGSSP